jgi:hypothetical protein
MSTSFNLAIIYRDTVRRFPLEQRRYTVGRDPFSDIFIGDPLISRHQLTLQPADDRVLVTMNPKSRNAMVRNGDARMSDEVYSGEWFQVGPFRFEVTILKEPPKAKRLLSADPAGPIDMSALDDSARIAPHWRSNEAAAPKPIGIAEPAGKALPLPAGAAATPAEAPGLSPLMRVCLLVLFCMLGGYLLYELSRPLPPPPPSIKYFADTDLMVAVKNMSCDSEAECLERARDSYQVARELLRSSFRDLVTLYKIVRHLHRARRALGENHKLFPDLDSQYQRMRDELRVAFADTAFLYERALSEQRLKEQQSILRVLMHLCQEDRHTFCAGLESAYFSFPDPGQ